MLSGMSFAVGMMVVGVFLVISGFILVVFPRKGCSLWKQVWSDDRGSGSYSNRVLWLVRLGGVVSICIGVCSGVLGIFAVLVVLA